MNAWAALPAAQEQYTQGMQPVGGTPEAFAATIATDLARWAGVIRAAGIQAE